MVEYRKDSSDQTVFTRVLVHSRKLNHLTPQHTWTEAILGEQHKSSHPPTVLSGLEQAHPSACNVLAAAQGRHLCSEARQHTSWSCDLFVLVQFLSCVRLFVTPGTAACQVSLSFTVSRNSP